MTVTTSSGNAASCGATSGKTRVATSAVTSPETVMAAKRSASRLEPGRGGGASYVRASPNQKGCELPAGPSTRMATSASTSSAVGVQLKSDVLPAGTGTVAGGVRAPDAPPYSPTVGASPVHSEPSGASTQTAQNWLLLSGRKQASTARRGSRPAAPVSSNTTVPTASSSSVVTGA